MSGRIDLKSVRLKTAQKYSNWLLFYLFFQKQAPFSVLSEGRQGAGQEGHRPGEDREAECVRHLAVHRCDDHREVCQAHHFSRQRVFKS